jgi:cytoskeleton-associated protein 5
VADKLGDPKTGTSAADALTAIAEATKLDFVATEVVVFAFNQKSPRLQQESMTWLSTAIQEFGFVLV